jgi:hypothetical protein
VIIALGCLLVLLKLLGLLSIGWGTALAPFFIVIGLWLLFGVFALTVVAAGANA